MILETQRLCLREMGKEDYAALCEILQDEDVMYAYEHAFDDMETNQWLTKQIENYNNYGFGLWGVILKSGGEMIGQCGLTMQDYGGRQVVEIGYLFKRAFWHHGYATEAAIACREYAFDTLGIDEVFSIIRGSNIPSQNVAMRNGMTPKGKIIKHYYGIDMPHFVFSVRKGE